MMYVCSNRVSADTHSTSTSCVQVVIQKAGCSSWSMVSMAGAYGDREDADSPDDSTAEGDSGKSELAKGALRREDAV